MINKIEITLEAIEEDETPEESERSTGSAPGYAEAVREVMEKATGNWGWCTARTTVRAISEEGKVVGEGYSYLGNCSYLSADDFILKSGYFPQKVEEALHVAIVKAQELKNKFLVFWINGQKMGSIPLTSVNMSEAKQLFKAKQLSTRVIQKDFIGNIHLEVLNGTVQKDPSLLQEIVDLLDGPISDRLTGDTLAEIGVYVMINRIKAMPEYKGD